MVNVRILQESLETINSSERSCLMNATSIHLLLRAKLALAVPEPLHVVLGHGVLPGALRRREEHGHNAPGRVDIDQHHHGEGVVLPSPGADIHRHLVKRI